MTVTRVLIADDHPILREGLTALLSSGPASTSSRPPGTGREAVQEVVLHRPDVAFLDLQMPELDGFGATREIVRLAPMSRSLC
jgi:CheY-like chemotaxis protein